VVTEVAAAVGMVPLVSAPSVGRAPRSVAPLAIAPRLARKIHNLHARVATASPAPRQRATLGENPRASLIHTHSQRHTGERLAHATVPRSIALDASRLLANAPSTHLADRPTRPCLLLKCPQVSASSADQT